MSDLSAQEKALHCARFADDKKAEDIVILDVRELVSFTDFFVICSGLSEPQLKAITGSIQVGMKSDFACRPFAADGIPSSQWLVLDYVDVVVHIFLKERRMFYGLEDVWSDAPHVAWAPEQPSKENVL
ncbi:MAG: ribosome silencing factor [Verrucomicrobiales bacterium]